MSDANDLTVTELLMAARERILDHREVAEPKPYPDIPAREFSLAITAIEDAAMRYTRGRAQELDVFSPADLDKIGDDPAAASKFLADRDQKASDAAK